MKPLKRAILKHGQNTQRNLALFSIGITLFFIGYGVLIWSNNSLSTSVGQELIATIGLLLLIIGGLIALLGYLGLSVVRLYNWLTEDWQKSESEQNNNEKQE